MSFSQLFPFFLYGISGWNACLGNRKLFQFSWACSRLVYFAISLYKKVLWLAGFFFIYFTSLREKLYNVGFRGPSSIPAGILKILLSFLYACEAVLMFPVLVACLL